MSPAGNCREDPRATTLPRGNCAGPRGELLERGKHLADKPARCFLCAGAERCGLWPTGRRRRRGKCVKNLLPGTEPQGLERSGEQTAPGKSRPPGLQPRNSRPEVRARKPIPGRRARTMPAAGPPTLEFPARGSRPKTETGETSANHAGHRARPVSIGPIPLPPAQPKNAGRQPGVSPYLPIFLSSYPIIDSSGLRSIPSNPSRYAFSSGSTSEMPPSWVASTFSGSTGSCRDFRRRNQPVWPFKS